MQETTIPESCGLRGRYRADFKQLVPRRRLRRQDCLKAPTRSKYILDGVCSGDNCSVGHWPSHPRTPSLSHALLLHCGLDYSSQVNVEKWFNFPAHQMVH